MKNRKLNLMPLSMCMAVSGLMGLFILSASAKDHPLVSTVSIECNWGTLTMESIQAGFPQGPHSADPSGDGHGPGTLDEPRAGLANVVERGDLQATCELIESLLDNDDPVVDTDSIKCNWGTLTMESILEDDFPQGPHSSDPSADGHGPGTADEPRAGLGNVVERGNLQATCELIDSLLNP